MALQYLMYMSTPSPLVLGLPKISDRLFGMFKVPYPPASKSTLSLKAGEPRTGQGFSLKELSSLDVGLFLNAKKFVHKSHFRYSMHLPSTQHVLVVQLRDTVATQMCLVKPPTCCAGGCYLIPMMI